MACFHKLFSDPIWATSFFVVVYAVKTQVGWTRIHSFVPNSVTTLLSSLRCPPPWFEWRTTWMAHHKQKSPTTKGRKPKDFWIGCKVKMKDYTFMVSPEQWQLLGVDSFKPDIFGSIIGKGTQSNFHWMVEFDGLGALEIDDKKLSKHPMSQKKWQVIVPGPGWFCRTLPHPMLKWHALVTNTTEWKSWHLSWQKGVETQQQETHIMSCSPRRLVKKLSVTLLVQRLWLTIFVLQGDKSS